MVYVEVELRANFFRNFIKLAISKAARKYEMKSKLMVTLKVTVTGSNGNLIMTLRLSEMSE